MKKTNKLWLLAMPLAFAACQNDAFEEFVQPSTGGFTLHATVEDETPQSRAQIQLYNADKSREYFMWNNQDQIAVFNKADLEAGSMTFYVSGSDLNENPTKSADFVSLETLEEGAEIAAVYPNVANAPMAEGLMGLEIPNYGDALISNEPEHYWNYEEGWRNYMKERMFMFASATVADHTASLHFRHLFAMARITFINTTEQEQRLNTVGLTGDATYFASQIALDMATGETTPISEHNYATITYDNGGRVLQPGESTDAYIIFFPGSNFTEYGTIQVMNGEQTSPVLDTKDIVMATATRLIKGFEAGMRYWFNIAITDEGLAWAKQEGPQITNIPLIAAIEEDLGFQFAKTKEGYVNVYENYSAIQDITWLNLSEKNLTDLSGIEYLPKLEGLHCYDNPLGKLDVSKSKSLKYLYAWNCELTELIVNEHLLDLYCHVNNLEKVDLSQCLELRRLDCSVNQLTSLDVTACPDLEELQCSENQLSSLYVSQASKLKVLSCAVNQLTSLDVTGCPDLAQLYCGSNRIGSLDVSRTSKLTTLGCENNLLSSLDVTGCSNLEELYCDGNQLSSLDVTRCPNLERLFCGGNLLSSLDVSQSSNLKILYGWSNELESLDVSKCLLLENLYVYSNRLNKLDLTINEKLVEVTCGLQHNAEGNLKKMAVKVTDEQKANNVVDLDRSENYGVVFGDGIPVLSGNGDVDNFTSGGKF